MQKVRCTEQHRENRDPDENRYRARPAYQDEQIINEQRRGRDVDEIAPAERHVGNG